jgi:hypothetical protein
MAQMLNDSAAVVRAAVKGKLESGRAMDQHYDHPILLMQHMVWHEGYHHGQNQARVEARRLSVRRRGESARSRGTSWLRKTVAP